MVCVTIKEEETHVKDFLESTSLHGARYLTEKNYIRKGFWFIALGVAYGFCSSQMHKTYMAFKAKPFSTTLTIERNDTEMKYFPAVTICNLNMISIKRYIETYRRWGIDFNQNITNDELAYDIMSFMTLMTYKGKGNRRLDEAKQKLYTSDDFKTRGPLFGEVLESFSHTMEGILSIGWLAPCKWRGEKCSAANFTSMVNLNTGRCYTFNSGNPRHPLLENPMIPGPSQGLRLKLNVQEEQHVTDFNTPSAGFKVLVHDQHEFPIMDELGFAIQPGTHTFASISATKYKNLANPFKTDCRSPNLPYSSYFGYPYSPQACVKQCLHDFFIEKCGCQPVHNITQKLPKKVSTCAKDCPSPCKLTKYTTKLSYASAISNAFGRTVSVYLKSLSKEERKSSDFANKSSAEIQAYLRDNLASIDIFFEDMSYTKIEQKPVYDMWALLANLGGYTGLFLGMSMLTGLEFLEFAGIWCFNKIRNSTKETKVSGNRSETKVTENIDLSGNM